MTLESRQGYRHVQAIPGRNIHASSQSLSHTAAIIGEYFDTDMGSKLEKAFWIVIRHYTLTLTT